MNIPIYRAKKVDSDDYVVGYLLPEFKGRFYLSTEWSSDMDGYTPDFVQINISTLSIHFPDMIDSQGNKIFASLQKDGKGGDVVDCRIAVNCDKPTRLKTIKYTKPYRFTIGVYDIDAYARKYITGIQE